MCNVCVTSHRARSAPLVRYTLSVGGLGLSVYVAISFSSFCIHTYVHRLVRLCACASTFENVDTCSYASCRCSTIKIEGNIERNRRREGKGEEGEGGRFTLLGSRDSVRIHQHSTNVFALSCTARRSALNRKNDRSSICSIES